MLILVILLAIILRFWQLGVVPPSLNWDEASNGYNAYSILKTAKDEYGNFLPSTFRSFGDYNPAMSVYTLVPSIAAFGLNQFAVRFPSAFLGAMTVLFTYLLVKELTKDKRVALFSAFFLAISPWHLHFSRYDHEANFMVAFCIIGLTCLLISFRKKSRSSILLLTTSAIFFGLALNSYHGAKIWVPLFLLSILIYFRKDIFKLGLKIFVGILVLFIFSLPYLLNIERTLIRGSSVGVLENPDKVNLIITGYLSHFAPNFIFTNGDIIGRHSVPGVGEEHIFELPLIVLGIIYVTLSKLPKIKFLLLWLLIAAIPASLATPTPHALRALTFIPTWSVFAAFGLLSLFDSNLKLHLKRTILIVLFVIAFHNIVTYLHLYYKHYPKEKAADWQYGYKDIVEYVDSVKDDYEVIAMSNYYGRPYIFVLFYSKFDPKEYQKQSADKEKFDKFEFFGSSWEKKVNGPALLIRPGWQKPDPPPRYLKDIKDTNGYVIFRISAE